MGSKKSIQAHEHMDKSYEIKVKQTPMKNKDFENNGTGAQAENVNIGESISRNEPNEPSGGC